MKILQPATAVMIRRLTISRFRGIESLIWLPAHGINIILGGGDVGKTTLLDAIGLLLSPTNSTVLSESDYWLRQVEHEFSIEAVMSLPAITGISNQNQKSWPWEWDGQTARPPNIDSVDGERSEEEPVYKVRVRGTSDLELSYELVHPDESTSPFSTGLRRGIGLVRLGGDDRNDRDLRLVQGSALDRLLADSALRSRVSQQFASQSLSDTLGESAKASIKELNDKFTVKGLPSSLGLGLTGSQGLSIGALVGLTAIQRGAHLPLASWGSGTRRLAALTIAASTQRERPITLVDEIERGLEPYRQRSLLADLGTNKSQVFMTTHSATAISSAANASLWYLDSAGHIGRLPKDKIERQQTRDPETFLARLTIVAEGAAEVGFVSALLTNHLGRRPRELGIWITDGHGHEATLSLLEALAEGGLRFGAFVDNEAGRYPHRWKAVKERLQHLLHRWPTGCLEENVIPLFSYDCLGDLIKDPGEEKLGDRLRTLADRLNIKDKSFESIKNSAGEHLHKLIIEASTGAIPDNMKDADESTKKTYKSHKDRWFKSQKGGNELAVKVLAPDIWPQLQESIMPFLDAVRSA